MQARKLHNSCQHTTSSCTNLRTSIQLQNILLNWAYLQIDSSYCIFETWLISQQINNHTISGFLFLFSWILASTGVLLNQLPGRSGRLRSVPLFLHFLQPFIFARTGSRRWSRGCYEIFEAALQRFPPRRRRRGSRHFRLFFFVFFFDFFRFFLFFLLLLRVRQSYQLRGGGTHYLNYGHVLFIGRRARASRRCRPRAGLQSNAVALTVVG